MRPVHVEQVDDTLVALQEDGVTVVREPTDMFWGERLAFVSDPEGNVEVLAGVGGT
jgi:lactoylglutathione lyase